MKQSPTPQSTKKAQQTNDEKQLSEFVVKACHLPLSLTVTAYTQFAKDYPIQKWLNDNKLTYEKVDSILLEKIPPHHHEVNVETAFIQDFNRIKVFHTVLCALPENIHKTENAQIVKYYVWHNLMELYSSLTQAYALEGLLPKEKDYLKGQLSFLYDVISFYSPQIKQLLTLLCERKNKESTKRYQHRFSLWLTYMSLLNIQHYHAAFLLTTGQCDKLPEIIEKLSFEIGTTDEKIISNFKTVNIGEFDATSDLNRAGENILLIQVQHEKAKEAARLSEGALRMEAFFAQIGQLALPAYAEDKAIYNKYADLLNKEGISFAAIYRIANDALNNAATTPAQFQNAVNILHFCLTHLKMGEPGTQYSRAYFCLMISALLTRVLSGYYNVIMHGEPKQITGKYVQLIGLIKANYQLYSQYLPQAQEFLDSLLSQNLTKETAQWHGAVKQQAYDILVDHLNVLKKICQIGFVCSDVTCISSALIERKNIIAYLSKNTKKLVRACQVNAKKIAQKIQEEEVAQKNYNVSLEEFKKSKDVMYMLDDALIQLLSNSAAPLQTLARAYKVNSINDLAQLVLHQSKTGDFEKALVPLAGSTILYFQGKNGKFDDCNAALTELNDCISLCQAWRTALIKLAADKKSEYVKLHEVHIRIVEERFGQLVVHFKNKSKAITEHIDAMPAKNMLLSIKTICLASGSPYYNMVYSKFGPQYFTDLASTNTMLENIIAYLETSQFHSKVVKLNIIHFLLQVVIDLDPAIHAILLSKCMEMLHEVITEGYEKWSTKPDEIVKHNNYFRKLTFYLELAKYYKSLYEDLLSKVMEAGDLYHKLCMRVKGDLFNRLLRLYEISLIEAKLLSEVKDVDKLKAKLEELKAAGKALDNKIQALEASLGKLSAEQLAKVASYKQSIRQLEESIKELVLSDDVRFSQLQNAFFVIIAMVLQQLETKKTCEIMPSQEPSPLSILDEMRAQSAPPNLATLEQLTAATQRIVDEKYLYEAMYFFQGLVDLCNHWSVILSEKAVSHHQKMVAEGFEDLGAACVQAMPRISILLSDTIDDQVFEDFLKEAGEIDALLLDDQHPALFAKFKNALFLNKAQTYLCLGRMQYSLKSVEDYRSIVNIMHFFNAYALVALEKEHGNLKSLKEQSTVFLWENLLYLFSKECEKRNSKAIPTGTYVASSLNLERLMALRDRYLPNINNMLQSWKRIENCSNSMKVDNVSWMLAEIAYSFETEFVYAYLAKGDYPSAKRFYDAAIQSLAAIKRSKNAAIYVKQIVDLEGYIQQLWPFFVTPPLKEFVVVNQMGVVLQKFEKFEGAFLLMLQNISQSPLQVLAKESFLNLQSITKESLVVRFDQFLKSCMQLKAPRYRRHAPTTLREAMELFNKFKNEFKLINDEKLSDTIIIELLCERIDALVQKCKTILPSLEIHEETVAQKEVMPAKELKPAEEEDIVALSQQLQKQTLSKKAKPKSPTQVEEPIRAVSQKSSMINEQIADQIKTLITQAQDIPAQCNNAYQDVLFNQYYTLFNDDHYIATVVKSAMSQLDLLSTNKDKASIQKVLNLSHFILQYFITKIATNPNVKLSLTRHLWHSLKAQILGLFADCLSNNIKLGECRNSYERLKELCELYGRYKIKRYITQDPTSFELMREQDEKLIGEFISQPGHLFQVLTQCQRQLKSLLTAQDDQAQNEAVKKTYFHEFRNFNLNNVQGAFYKLTQSEKAPPSKAKLALFSTLLGEWIKSFQKGAFLFMDKMQVELLQETQDECATYISSEAKKAQVEPSKALEEPVEVLVRAPSSGIEEDVNDNDIVEVSAHLKALQIKQPQPDEAQPESPEPKEPLKPKRLTAALGVAAFKPRELHEVALSNAQLRLQEIFSRKALTPIRNLFDVLRAKGIKATLTGGFLRDVLLNNSTFHDYDIYVHCSVKDFCALFPGAYQLAPLKRPELLRIHELDDMRVLHDIVCSENGCPYTPDFTVNSLSFDGITLSDPYNAICDFDSLTFKMVGDSEQRYKADPSLILRSIRLLNSSRKLLEEQDEKCFLDYAPQVTSIEMGLYLPNLAALFFRSYEQAMLNIHTIIKKNLLCCLLPAPLCNEEFFKTQIEGGYLQHKIKELYAQHTVHGCTYFHEGTKYYKQLSYRLLAIFLIPFVMRHNPTSHTVGECIKKVVDYYCVLYKGFNPKAESEPAKANELKRDKEQASKRLMNELMRIYPKDLLDFQQAQWFVPQGATFTPQYQQLARIAASGNGAAKLHQVTSQPKLN